MISLKNIDDWTMKIMECNIWSYILRSLQDNSDNNRHGFWTDEEEILCKTEAQAELVADFFEDLGFCDVQTGYYDPKEDEKNNEVDIHTGYWYVSVD